MAAHVLLEDAGADYIGIPIDLKSGWQRSKEYLDINPKGRVPALIADGKVLTETPSILAYVAQMFPEKELAPKEPFEFAFAQSINMYLSSTVHVGHAHKQRGGRWATDENAILNMKAKVTENMTEYAKTIQNHYFHGPWVLGENYSMCDPYLAVITKWFYDDGVNMDNFKLISEHYDRIRKRPSMMKILEMHNLI